MTDLDGTARRRPPAQTLEDEHHRARLAVADHSTSVEDCRELLDMLGLLPEPEATGENP